MFHTLHIFTRTVADMHDDGDFCKSHLGVMWLAVFCVTADPQTVNLNTSLSVQNQVLFPIGS